MSSEPIPDFVFPKNTRWQCIRCARCCGDVGNRKRRIVMLPSEVAEICEHLGLQKEDFADTLEGHESYKASMKKREGKCIFLRDNNCRIYEVRPLVCRFFPVWLVKEDLNYSFNVTDKCPGIGKGAPLGREDFIFLLRTALSRRGQTR